MKMWNVALLTPPVLKVETLMAPDIVIKFVCVPQDMSHLMANIVAVESVYYVCIFIYITHLQHFCYM